MKDDNGDENRENENRENENEHCHNRLKVSNSES